MLKAVSVLGFMRAYGKELLHSSRPISTSLYRASEGIAEPASSSTEKPEETADVDKNQESTTEPIAENTEEVVSTMKPEATAIKTTEVGAQEAKQKEKVKDVLEVALQTKQRILKCNQLLKKLESLKQPLTDEQMAALIYVGGIYRGSSIVAVRRQYVTNLVNTLKEQGQKPGILAMNALMAVKLDNDEDVDVVEFLQQLEYKGLELNNMSYELMARAYAKNGNVNAILRILSHLKEEDNVNVTNTLLNWLAFAEGVNGNVKNVGTIAKASNTEEHWHSAGVLYLNAALGLAQKGDINTVMNILSRTRIRPDNYLDASRVFDIYMAFLSNNHLDALEKLSPYLGISQDTGCLPNTLNYNYIVRHLDKLITNENFDAFEQVWNILPKEKKGMVLLQTLPARQMLNYALKLMDEGRTEEYKNIIDAFKNCNSFSNSDDFFFHFIEEYFKRQNKPIDVVEAFSIYMKVTQIEGEVKKKNYHRKTVGNLLRLALSTYKLVKSGDSQKHIYDITHLTGYKLRWKLLKSSLQNVDQKNNAMNMILNNAFLDTIEQDAGKYERNIFQQQVLTDVIGGQIFATKKQSKEKKTDETPDKPERKPKNLRAQLSEAEVTNLLEPSAV